MQEVAKKQTFAAKIASSAEWNEAMKSGSRNNNANRIEIDTVSEVHRFIASAATKRMDLWYKHLKSVTFHKKQRLEKGIADTRKVAKRASQTKKIAIVKIKLCRKIFCSCHDLPDQLPESYYNSTMKALNMGGLLLVQPVFFDWGAKTMKVIRASIQR